jgi:tetratricopeptide (TPR) repeat protein
MADYAVALQLAPNNPATWVSRGNEWRKHLKLDDAIADFTHAIQLDPKYLPAYLARGNAWKQRRVFDKAIQEFTEVIRIDPENAPAHQALARILATCHEANFRNGNLALREATRACELTHWLDPDCLDTLATACAEVGNFDAAVQWQTQAIKVLGQDTSPLRRAMDAGGRRGVQFEDRLTFYKSKKAARE